MAKASDKYRNWFASEKLVSDMMDEAADDIDERDAEIERLRKALHDCIYVLAMDGAVEGSLRVIEIVSVALQQKDTE